MTFCKHYQAMASNDVCRAGVRYDDVLDTSVTPYRWPCFSQDVDDGCATLCAQMVFPTAEEEQAALAGAAQFFTRFARLMSGELRECLVCGAAIEKLEQIGRCVYAAPCGCRQYQGKVSAAWKAGRP